jgi:NADH dehydrogenase
MTERQVVLFGGLGFVGRHLAPRLAAEGWTVRVASRHSQPEAASAAGGVVAVTADLGAEDQVRRGVSGAEKGLSGLLTAMLAGTSDQEAVAASRARVDPTCHPSHPTRPWTT